MSYVLLSAWTLLSAVATSQSNYKRRNSYTMHYASLYLVVFCFVCSLLMGLRSVNVGVDTASYKEIFENISVASLSEILSGYSFASVEIGYALLAKLISVIYNNYYFFQLIFSFIFCFGIGTFIKNNCSNYLLSTTLFLGTGLYLLAFNISRQMFAVMIVINGWKYIKENKRFKALLFVVLGVLFHISAVVCVFAYVLFLLKDYKILLYVIPVVLLLFALFYKQLFNLIAPLFPTYSNYFKNAKVKQTAGGVVIIWFIIALFSLYILYKKNKFSNEEKVYAIFSLIYVITNYIGLAFNYFERIGIYFLPFTLILFETIGKSFKDKNVSRCFVVAVSVCFLGYFILSAMSPQYVYSTFLS